MLVFGLAQNCKCKSTGNSSPNLVVTGPRHQRISAGNFYTCIMVLDELFILRLGPRVVQKMRSPFSQLRLSSRAARTLMGSGCSKVRDIKILDSWHAVFRVFSPRRVDWHCIFQSPKELPRFDPHRLWSRRIAYVVYAICGRLERPHRFYPPRPRALMERTFANLNRGC